MDLSKTNGLSIKEQLQEQLKALEREEDNKIVDLRNNPQPRQDVTPISYEWPDKFTPAQRKLIGEAIAKARSKIPGMSQHKLERLCGFGTHQISYIETGKAARLDKATIKKMGFHLGLDFNEVIMEICAEPEDFAADKKEAFIALGPRLEEDEERTYKLKSSDFELKCKISNHEYELSMVVEGLNQQIYAGRRSKDCLFLQALEKIIKMVKRDA